MRQGAIPAARGVCVEELGRPVPGSPALPWWGFDPLVSRRWAAPTALHTLRYPPQPLADRSYPVVVVPPAGRFGGCTGGVEADGLDVGVDDGHGVFSLAGATWAPSPGWYVVSSKNWVMSSSWVLVS